MFKITKGFSNFDVFAIVKELEAILLNGSISNVYEIQDLLILKIKTNVGKKNLIIKKDTRINFTEFNYPIPEFPNQNIRTFRKFLKNRRITSVSQYKFDRIIIIELNRKEEGSWKLVIELFNKGNFLLLDQNNTIIIAKRYKKFKDRAILAKREYIFPKSQGKNFLTLNKEEFKILFLTSENEIVRDLSRNLKLSGLHSEEICYRADVNKKKIGKNLKDEELNKLYDSFKNLRNQLLFGSINAHIVLDQQEEEVTVLPFELEILKEYRKKRFSNFNDAVDEFYSKIDYRLITNPKDQKINAQIKSQEKILLNQQEYLEELRLKKKRNYEIGEYIYANLNTFERLTSVILEARKKGYSWDEINRKLLKAKIEKINGAEFFKKILPSKNQILISFNENEVNIDLKKSVGDNANIFYTRGKKADKKITGTLTAILDTQEKLEKFKNEKESIEIGIDFLIKKRKKRWYEKFRWFESTEDFLIIGGRDATSNEIIFKKYMDMNDLVFHTNIPGSPLVVIKNPENRNIPLNTIEETAEFVASFSRAWKENWGVVDVFYVHTNQVTKTPSSGEYIQKGSFIILGKKNIIRNAKTRLTIGLKLIELEDKPKNNNKKYIPQIISGPERAIKIRTDMIRNIVPTKSSKLSKGKFAKVIKTSFINSVDRSLKKWVELLSIDEILLYLPNGLSEFRIGS